MFWHYWAQERGSDPPVYSPVIRQGGQRTVLATVTAHWLPPGSTLVGEFSPQARVGGGPAVPLEVRN
jgi:hypothetical protein